MQHHVTGKHVVALVKGEGFSMDDEDGQEHL